MYEVEILFNLIRILIRMSIKKQNCDDLNLSAQNDAICYDFQISNLEKRMQNTEKFLVFFEELLKLKNEERIAENMINNLNLSELEQRLVICEEDYKSLIKKKNSICEESLKKLESFDIKINSSVDTKNTNFGNRYASSYAEMEALLKKNDFLIENTFERKLLYFYQLLDTK